jgi:hypothetical protein
MKLLIQPRDGLAPLIAATANSSAFAALAVCNRVHTAIHNRS